jgi:hypothetical protein
VRDQSDGGDAEAAAGSGDERAPVSGGAALWLVAEAREVAAVQHRSGEGEFTAWGENFDWRRRGDLFEGGRWEEESKGVSGGRARWPTRGGSGA